MVTVNLTLFVVLGMFLVFLWAMHRFVFTPALRLTDTREAQMVEDRNVARTVSGEAAQLEDDYKAKLSALHREANLRITRTHRMAQEEHHGKVEALKKKGEQELRALRKEIADEIAAQQEQFTSLSREIAQAMAERLELDKP